LVTDNQPTFSAIVHNNISRLSEDDFIATVDGEHVRCMFNAALNEVSFTPASPLKNGNHHAMLIFKNPDGSARSLYLSFRIDTEPPNIDLVMWSKKENYTLVILDRPVEPSLLADTSRWLINNETGITRADIYLLGGTTAFLPLENSYFGKYTNKEPLTITFVDKNGSADYIVRRGGSMVRKVQEDYDCACNISVNILQEHKILEAGAERYAFCYDVTPKVKRCNLVMEWEGWTVTSIGNLNPVGINENDNKYDLQVDTICANQTQSGGPGVHYPPDLGFQMILDGNEIETVALEREYAHILDVSFWADCTTGKRYGDPEGSDYETWIADKHFSFSESFDCLLPEFDEEPIVLYGDEAAEFIHYGLMGGTDPEPPNPPDPPNWPTDIPMAGESVRGDLYCFGIDRDNYNYLMQDLIAHKCDLFIVTGAYDPTKQGMDGNMSTKQMVLDYKYTDGTYEYGESSVGGGQAVMNVLVIDKKPWGGLYLGFNPDDLELIEWLDNDWNSTLLISQEEYNPDPKKRYYKHDWCGEEIAINLWNLTDILTTSEEEIKEIKVRITDHTPDPVDGYHGNWRRSTDVMEQIDDLSNRAVARFINDNPYDDDPNWKIVKYSGNTNDKSTSFIYNRNIDQPTGRVAIDFFIMVEYFGHFDPRLIGEPISVRFSSTESRFPQDCSHDVIIQANLIEANDPILSEFPGGYSRLIDLFSPTVDCPLFYHTRLIVTDSNLTNADLNVLYISSNDHLLGNPSKLDYSKSLGKGYYDYTPNENFSFGTNRGRGFEIPTIAEKDWYSCDEMVVNGGFEIISVNILDANLNVEENDDIYTHIPVQSEADILLIMSHSTWFGDSASTVTLGFSCPFYTNFGVEPHQQFTRFGPYFNSSAKAACFYNIIYDYYFCSDFGSPPHSGSDFGLGWGDFWLKKAGDLRWLTLWTCGQLSRIGTYKPCYHWKTTIEKGYLDSVSGFATSFQPIRKHDRTLFNDFSNKLDLFITSNNYNYNPNSYVYSDESMWIVDDQTQFTRDIHVAAWMEASCLVASKCVKKIDWKRYRAESIDYDHVDGIYYNWRLIYSKPYGGLFRNKFKYKIIRNTLN